MKSKAFDFNKKMQIMRTKKFNFIKLIVSLKVFNFIRSKAAIHKYIKLERNNCNAVCML